MPTETSLSFATLWLTGPATLFLLFIPGFVTLVLVLSFGKRPTLARTLSFSEYLFWTLTLSIFFDGWLSFTLGELGLFSLGAVLAIALAYSLLLVGLRFSIFKAFWQKFKNQKSPWLRTKLDGYVLAILLVGALGLNYAAPHETIVGAQDSGIYFNAGANLARTGAFIVHDPLLPALDEAGPKTQPQVLLGMPGTIDRFLFVAQQRLPGFFVMDRNEGLAKGEVIPQLFHFYPALLALGMSLFGLWGGLWVTPLLGVMAIFAVYLATRRLFPTLREKWIAPLAALFLMLNAVQVWFSRETLWEILGEFLVFTAIYAFTLVVRPGQLESTEVFEERDEAVARLGGLGVGLALGLICLAHAQFPFMIWPLLPYFIWTRLTRRWGMPQWLMLGSFLVLALHTVLHIRLFAIAYFEGVYHHPIIDMRNALHILIPVATSAFLALVVLDALPNLVQAITNWIRRHWNLISLALMVVVMVYVFYSYFIRVYAFSTDGQGNYPEKYWSLSSYIGAPTTEGPERNLLRIGWYFSPPGMLLAFLGLAAVLARRLNALTGFFLALTLGVSFIFLDYNYTLEHYIYSMRRYITATIPALAIFVAYACIVTLPDLLNWCWRKLKGLSGRRVVYSVATAQGVEGNRYQVTGDGKSLDGTASNTIHPSILPVTHHPSPDTLSPANHQPVFRFAGLALAAGLIIFLVWTGKTIFFLHEYGPSTEAPGVVEQLHQLAANFDSKDILIFVGERDQDAKLATPLTYAFGMPSFDLVYAVKNDELGDLLRSWERQGYHIKALLGPNGGRFSPTGYTLKQTGDASIVFRQLQQLIIQKPNNPQTNTLLYGIYDVVAGTASDLATGTGRVDSQSGWTLQIGKGDWPALINGFYNVERDPDGLPYRWTETDGVLRVPCLVPDGGPARLTLTMSSGTTRPTRLPPLSVKVYLSNNPYDEPTFRDPKRLKELTTLTLQPNMQDYVIDLPTGQDKLTCDKSASSLILSLTVDATQTWVPQQEQLGDDTRRLAIKLTKINLVSKGVLWQTK